MPITFNMLLDEAGISPRSVRLLRHETKKHRGRTPYSVWRDNPLDFETYQRTQLRHRRAWFAADYWASFVVTPDGSTLFVGLFAVSLDGAVPVGWRHVLDDQPLNPDTVDLYDTARQYAMEEYAAVLKVDWGAGARSWVQRADNQDKKVVELRQVFQEESFPGYQRFLRPLSELPQLPLSWRSPLSASRGVYLLTCPRTKEQYVGSATGADGFWGRWQAYLNGGDGGNRGLKSRDPSDYQVSILQVAGSDSSAEEIILAEQLWKQKLQSREMGLNRN